MRSPFIFSVSFIRFSYSFLLFPDRFFSIVYTLLRIVIAVSRPVFQYRCYASTCLYCHNPTGDILLKSSPAINLSVFQLRCYASAYRYCGVPICYIMLEYRLPLTYRCIAKQKHLSFSMHCNFCTPKLRSAD